MAKLSVIMPVYNERATIEKIVDRVQNVSFGDTNLELVIVDDGSKDGTRDVLSSLKDRHTIIFHEQNQGKGAAIRTGLSAATGDFLVVQDADLEYDPADLPKLLEVLHSGATHVVYGSRVLGKEKGKEYSSYVFHLGGLLVTWWTNFLFGTRLTDEATCYKMFTRKALSDIELRCTGFEFCPEFTGKVLQKGHTIVEVPISYTPRGHDEGKKIKLRDGATALWTLLRVRLTGK